MPERVIKELPVTIKEKKLPLERKISIIPIEIKNRPLKVTISAYEWGEEYD